MITALIIWYIGTAFTFTYNGETNKGWESFGLFLLCLISWPYILGELIREDIGN